MPLDWAMTQNNIAGALRTLGERESGIARLQQAVAAHRNAIAVRQQSAAPDHWSQSAQSRVTELEELIAQADGRSLVARSHTHV